MLMPLPKTRATHARDRPRPGITGGRHSPESEQ